MNGELAASGDLENYHLFHAARADLLPRIDSRQEAAQSYSRALELVTNDRERRYLQHRLREVQSYGPPVDPSRKLPSPTP